VRSDGEKAMTDLKNDLEQILISEGTKAMMLKLAEESYRQGVNDTLQSAKEAAEKAFVLGIEKALAAEQEACAKVCEEATLKNWFAEDCVALIRERNDL
jgi:hypothetical protein